MSSYLLLLLLVLACPLMMMWMMRGGGHSGHGNGQDGGEAGSGERHDGRHEGLSLDELGRRREELDREIEEREASEDDLRTPVGGGWR